MIINVLPGMPAPLTGAELEEGVPRRFGPSSVLEGTVDGLRDGVQLLLVVQ